MEANEWYAMLTTRQTPNGATENGTRTDVLVSQMPLTGIKILNGVYTGPPIPQTTNASKDEISSPTPSTPRRSSLPSSSSSRSEPLSADPHARLRGATRVADVLTVVYQLDNVKAPDDFHETNGGGNKMNNVHSSSTSHSNGKRDTNNVAVSTNKNNGAVSTNNARPPVALSGGGANPPAAEVVNCTDVFALDNSRRLPPRPQHPPYKVVAILGPVESRQAAISLGVLWRFNKRAVESRCVRGYHMSLHYEVPYHIQRSLPPNGAQRKRTQSAPDAIKKRVVEEQDCNARGRTQIDC